MNMWSVVQHDQRTEFSVPTAAPRSWLRLVSRTDQVYLKAIGSSFIGTSPQFELALYTLCFACGKEKNELMVGPYKTVVTCFKMGYGRNIHIGTTFPEIAPLSEDEAAQKLQSIMRGRQARKTVGVTLGAGSAAAPMSKSAQKNAARKKKKAARP